MAFKVIKPTSAVPDSPEKLFLDLPRRKLPTVQPHQQELMHKYASIAIDERDVALQLPTGSGKTLVGLLIGEWRRRKYGERVVYLAPTKQLVNQVVEQAVDKYGITVHGFLGPKNKYNPKASSDYKNGDHIAVTTYSSVFNSNPFFNQADLIILDDVHTAANYISDLWTIRLERFKPEHRAIFTQICNLLKQYVDPLYFSRLIDDEINTPDRNWVDKLPTPDFTSILAELTGVMDIYANTINDLKFSWQMIRNSIHACHLYYSAQEILIRPLIPPTWMHDAFTHAKQRIYMSATLGEGGDLERLVGRSPISRIPVSEGWERHGVGRRFFVFPEMALSAEESKDLKYELMKQTERSLILVPNTRLRDEITDEVVSNLGYEVFNVEDIENSKKEFIAKKSAVAIIANRYDGIDFPGNECRLLFIEGLPSAINIQERFFMMRMGANILFNERIQTRVLQAIGRCTRSLEDYSVVVVSGGELPDYLADMARQKYLYAELQAEIRFGLEQSRGSDAKNMIENVRIFLDNGQEWENVSQQIVAYRKEMKKNAFPCMDELASIAGDEINYQKKLIQKDYEASLRYAEKILSVIKSTELKGYRALWHYLAGCAAWQAVQAGGSQLLSQRAKDEFSKARDATQGISWLVKLSRYSGEKSNEKESDESIILEQVERLESELTSLGKTYERQYILREKEIIEGLQSDNTIEFEKAHMLLGRMIGFDSDNKETDGSPDPWWINSTICIVFEDHSGASEGSIIDITKARQVASHPLWMKANVPAAEKAQILPVLITPANNIKLAAIPPLDGVCIWKLNEFQQWALGALEVIRELRTKLLESENIEWRTEAIALLRQKKYDAISIVSYLKEHNAKDKLLPIR